MTKTTKMMTNVMTTTTTKKVQVRICILLVGCVFVLRANAQEASPDAASVFARVQKLYGETDAIRAQFTARMPDANGAASKKAVFGTLLVKRGNHFRLDLPDRTIVCNGKTVWNYDRTSKKLVISPFKDNAATISPERIFLSFPKNYKPTLKKELKSEGGLWRLTLVPASPKELVGGMQHVEMRLQPTTLMLKELKMSDDATVYQWTMAEFKLGVPLLAEQFEFQPPKDAQVIDLRD
jgi:outer membrane lipoprotein-sorting protein